jgi:signal transduction histidine kinase
MDKYRQRKKYFIDKSFQGKFIITFCLIVVVSALLSLVVLLFLSRDSNTVAIENTRVIVKSTADFMWPIVVQTVLVTLIFSSLAAIILTLLFSHKLSGPLVRLTKEVEALEKGDLTRGFTTRGTDQLKKFSRSLFSMTQTMDRHFQKIKEEQKVLRDLLQQKDFVLTDEDKHKARELLDDLNKHIEFFKTS